VLVLSNLPCLAQLGLAPLVERQHAVVARLQIVAQVGIESKVGKWIIMLFNYDLKR
jgi:hypothetical protein